MTTIQLLSDRLHIATKPFTTSRKAVILEIPEGEDANQAMDLFKKLVKRSGVMQALRVKNFHESAAEKAKRKAKQVKMSKRYYRMNIQRNKASSGSEYPIDYDVPVLYF